MVLQKGTKQLINNIENDKMNSFIIAGIGKDGSLKINIDASLLTHVAIVEQLERNLDLKIKESGIPKELIKLLVKKMTNSSAEQTKLDEFPEED